MHLKRVISNANVKSPLVGISKTNTGYLEALVLSSGLGNVALIMLEGQIKNRLKNWVTMVGGLGSVCST
jgi:hypothetical protein